MSNLKDLARERRPPQALPTPAEKALDAEMRELVLKFEEIYAQLAPEAEEASNKSARPDDIFPDFPGEVAVPSKHQSVADRALTAHTVSRLEPVLTGEWRAEADSTESKGTEEHDGLDIDEAMSILRDEKPSSLVQPAPAALYKSVNEPALLRRMPESAAAAADADGSTRSRTFWSMALIAASVALVVGTGVGYMMGRGQETASVAKIQTSPQGGAKLRPDYELRKR